MMQVDTAAVLEALADGACLVTVNQRLSRHWVERYQRWQVAQGATHWPTANIVPWAAWLESLHVDALMAGLSEHWLPAELAQRQLWRRVVAESAEVLLNPGMAADGAREAWAIGHAWRCFGGAIPGQSLPATERLSLDQFAFKRWADRYHEMSLADTFVDAATLPDHLATIIKTHTARTLLPARVVLAGFDALTPQQQDFFSTCAEGDCAVVKHVSTNAQGELKVGEFADANEELAAVVSATRALVDSDASTAIAVVIPDLHARRSEVLAAFDREYFPTLNPDEILQVGRPYDLSLGLPLSEMSVVRSALLALQLVYKNLETAELSRLLHSPYLAQYDDEHQARELLDRNLRADGYDRLDATQLLKCLLERYKSHGYLLAALQQTLQSCQRSVASAGVWAARFGQLLGDLDWPGTGLDSTEYQAVQAWYGCLDRLVQLDDGNEFDSHTALHELSLLADEQVFQLDTPHVPIQIMGRLESRGLQVDQLFVTGLDSSAWPALANPSPYLPITAQQQAGYPAASHEISAQLAETEFLAWQRAAPQVMFSYAIAKGDEELVGSPLLLTLAAINDIAIERNNPSNALSVLEAVRSSIGLEAVIDQVGPPVQDDEALRGGAKLFENQALCPFKAFAAHRLGVRALEEPNPGLDPRETGNLVHAALENFWCEVKTSNALLAMNEANVENALVIAINKALDERDISEPLRTLEALRIEKLLKQWIDGKERCRVPFAVLSTEKEFEIDYSGVQVKLKVDRIDQLATGEKVIIDYKTGTSNTISGWGAERIENPQLPIYATSQDNIKAVAFAQVARHQCRFLGVASDDDLLPDVKPGLRNVEGVTGTADWEACQAHWRSSLHMLAAEIHDGHAAVDPTTKACHFCELAPLCRVDADALKLRQAALSENGEEDSP